MSLWSTLTYPFKRQGRRPLATRRPERAEMGQERKTLLGMEATDMSIVDAASRRNDALDRSIGNRIQDGQPLFGRASTYVEAMPEDETYARRYTRVFQRKGQTDE